MVATGKPGHEARKPFLESALANFNNLTQAFMLRLFAIDLLFIKNKIKFEICKHPLMQGVDSSRYSNRVQKG